MTRAAGVALLVALACTEHEPELTRVGGPELDASSDAMPPIESGANEDVTWCQATTILEPVCQRCHSDPPQNGAPFPLVTYQNTQAQYYDTDLKIWEQMREAVSTNFMPAMFVPIDPPVEPLSCEQKRTLLGWLEQGARDVGGLTCTDADKTLVDCSAGGAGGAGSEAGAGGGQ